MGCVKCQKTYKLNVCRVCELIDNDLTIKKVRYCKVCDAYICNLCNKDYIKRVKAAFKDL